MKKIFDWSIPSLLQDEAFKLTPTKPNVFQRSNFEPDEGEESDASQEDPDVEGEGGAPGPLADLAEDANPEQPGKEVLDAVAWKREPSVNSPWFDSSDIRMLIFSWV